MGTETDARVGLVPGTGTGSLSAGVREWNTHGAGRRRFSGFGLETPPDQITNGDNRDGVVPLFFRRSPVDGVLVFDHGLPGLPGSHGCLLSVPVRGIRRFLLCVVA